MGGGPFVQGHQIQQHLGTGGLDSAAGAVQCGGEAAVGSAHVALDRQKPSCCGTNFLVKSVPGLRTDLRYVT